MIALFWVGVVWIAYVYVGYPLILWLLGLVRKVEPAIRAIMGAARTGEIGDGRVFVIPVEHGYNIRTGERDIV